MGRGHSPNRARAQVLSILLSRAEEAGSGFVCALNQPALFFNDMRGSSGARVAFLGGEVFEPRDVRANSTDQLLLVMRNYKSEDPDDFVDVSEGMERMFDCFDGLREYIEAVESSADDEDMATARDCARRLEDEADRAELARRNKEDPDYGSW